MTEGLFVLTTLFVAYVIYVIVNEKKAGSAASKSAAATQPQPVQQAAVTVVEEKPKAAPVKAKPAAKKVPAKPAAVEKTAEAPVAAPEPAAIKSTGLKDPKTGEVATTYSNYRFTKRWIKEALVAENLVEKVYKNDELNADVEAKIKAGIAKLEGMEKYKA
ncbi:hypothetical protein [Methyloglobulus sp.]|uniref:hypothetical protein n=1 Tax=Methyloglobulus sp. TaxID=2518622 RepID=UPI0032B7443A